MTSIAAVRPSLQQVEINEQMTARPAAFVAAECERYRANVAQAEPTTPAAR